MNTFEAIITRRSIRLYKNTPIPDELFESIIKAG
ncbi:MAG: nitroreductase family protein, partial [Ignavibacteriales bacterium]